MSASRPAATVVAPGRGAGAGPGRFEAWHLLLGGLVLGATDAVILVADRPLRDRGDLLLAAAALLTVVPVAWFLASAAVLAGAAGLTRLAGTRCGMDTGLHVLLAAAILLPFTSDLASGPWVSSLRGTAILPWAAALAGGAVTIGILRIAGGSGCASRRRAVLGAVLLAAAAAAAIIANGLLYPALYPAAHALLAIGAAAALTAAARRLWPAPPGRRRAALAAAAALFAAAAATGVPALSTAGIVQAWLDRTTSGAPVVQALLGFGVRPGGLAEMDSSAFQRIASAMPAGSAPLPAAGSPLPAVVIITLEATRVDHLVLGRYSRRTDPELERFAGGCLVFDDAWCAANSSHETLVALFGARHPDGRESGVAAVLSGLKAPGTRAVAFFPDGNLLRHHDLFGAWDEIHRYGQRAGEIVDRVDDVLAAAAGSPLFLWLHLFDPHAPYDPLPADRIFGDAPIDLYDAEILAMDRAFGRIVESLDRRLGRENVVIAVTADHGESFGENGVWFHKSGLGEEQIRVPILFRAPGLAPRRDRDVASHVDILPTAFGLAGWPMPAGDGRDLRCSTTLAARAVYCRHEGRAIAVRRGRWKVTAALRTGDWSVEDLDGARYEYGDDGLRAEVESMGDALLAFDCGPGGLLGLTFGEPAVLREARRHAHESATSAGAFARRILARRP